MTEIVFSYPGLGYQIYRAITNEDYFVIQGIFLFIIVGVLIANFLVDLVYVLDRPAYADRHAGRTGMSAVAVPAPEQAPRALSSLREMVHFALRNRKLVFGLGVMLVDAPVRLFGPMLAQHPPHSSTAASSRWRRR